LAVLGPAAGRTAGFLRSGYGQRMGHVARKGLANIGVMLLERPDVHLLSLGALTRERLTIGEPVPDDTLGVTVGRLARIVR
jgi:hypothetical protein